MTADSIIEELKALGPADRLKVRAYLDEVDLEIPESFRLGMQQALSGNLIDMEEIIQGAKPPPK